MNITRTLARRLAARARRRLGGDAGAGAVEIVIVFPLLIAIVLAIIQFALAEQARHVAQTAADQALAASRTQHGSASGGQAAGDAFLSGLHDGALRSPSLSVTRGGGRVVVTTRGEVDSLLPGMHFVVVAKAAGPIENWTTP